jgi:molecular chaperone DnaJ
MSDKPDYYEVLSVSRTASNGEISSAYRKLAIKYHPDKNPGDEEAIAQFKIAAEAFEVLSDADKRARYDRYGHAGLGSSGAGHFTDVEDIFSAFGDMFGDLFGGGGGGGRRRGGKRVRRGADVRADVTLDLLEAAHGVEKTVRFRRHERCADCEGTGARPGTEKSKCQYCGGHGQVVQSSGIFRMQTTCPACNGEGQVIKNPCSICQGTGQMPKQVSTTVKIPAGVDSGTQLRISGEGEPGPNGGPAGDCYCFITVEDHPLFERDGQHLICRVPISYSQAALGASLEVPTLDGREELEVPAGTQSGQVFRMRGRGMPDPRHHGRGDLLVQTNIEVPKQLNAQEEELLRKLAELEKASVTPHRKTFFERLKEYFVPEDETTLDEKAS